MGRAQWHIALAAVSIGLFGTVGVSAQGADLPGDSTAQSNGSVAPATQPALTQQQMMDRINALQSEVDQLKNSQQKQTIDEAAEMQTAQQVLADADRQTALFDASGVGFTNYNDLSHRFQLSSADGNFVLRPWVHLQFRYSASYRQQSSSASADTEAGFETRRARFGFDGNLFTPNLTYFINWASLREDSSTTIKNSSGATVGAGYIANGGVPVLEEAWLKYNFDNTPFYVKAGQLHDPFDHEAIIGSKYRAPETSLTGDLFANTDTFTKGATFIYDPKQDFRFEGGFTGGMRSANTNFEDGPMNNNVYDWGVAARGEYKFFGNWKDYDQLTAYNDKKDLLVLGLGLDDSGAAFNSFSHTLDVQYGSPSGLFFYGSYLGRYTNKNPGFFTGGPVGTSLQTPAVPGQDTYEYTLLGQVAYLIDGKLEPYLRVEHLDLAGTPAGSENHINEVSLGANYYLYGHNLKFTAQVMYLPNGIPVNDDTNDILISNDRAEYVLITQIQLLL